MAKSFIGLLVLALLIPPAEASQDPTAPLGWKKPVVSEPVKPAMKRPRLPNLNSIVCRQSNQCVAVLNNQVVEQGAKIHGYRVAQINSEFVTLKRGSDQWKLKLFSLNVKK